MSSALATAATTVMATTTITATTTTIMAAATAVTTAPIPTPAVTKRKELRRVRAAAVKHRPTACAAAALVWDRARTTT